MKTARELGLIPQGRLEPGPGNAITDVAGVSVGHRSLRGEGLFTGVTAILPHAGDVFRVKPRAAVEVINGFGKSAGLMQVAELGTIETPIMLTNTFGVAACTEALVRRAISANPAIGRKTSTVNALVCECNDGSINDIQALAVTPADAEAALDAARTGPVEQGAVGAGSGMTAFGFKAGIGTASRRMRVGKRDFTLGTLVLANFGAAGTSSCRTGAGPIRACRPVPSAAPSSSSWRPIFPWQIASCSGSRGVPARALPGSAHSGAMAAAMSPSVSPPPTRWNMSLPQRSPRRSGSPTATSTSPSAPPLI